MCALVKVIGQLCLFSPSTMGPNSGREDWKQARLPAKPPHWPLSCFNIIEMNCIHYRVLPANCAMCSFFCNFAYLCSLRLCFRNSPTQQESVRCLQPALIFLVLHQLLHRFHNVRTLVKHVCR